MTSDIDPRIIEALMDGPMTTPEITRRLFPVVADWEYPSRRSKIMARCQKLVRDGTLSKRTMDGRIFFEVE